LQPGQRETCQSRIKCDQKFAQAVSNIPHVYAFVKHQYQPFCAANTGGERICRKAHDRETHQAFESINEHCKQSVNGFLEAGATRIRFRDVAPLKTSKDFKFDKNQSNKR